MLYQYINKVKKDDIIKYCLKQKIDITNNELDIIYNYIKNDYVRIIDNPIEVIDEIKDKINNNLYNKIIELYDKYKNVLDTIK